VFYSKLLDKLLKSKLFKNSAIYTITNVLNKSIPFLLIPILTRYLSTESYGIIAMFTVLVGFVGPFTGLSIHGAVQLKYYKKEETDFPVYLTNSLLVLICSTTITSIFIYLFANQIESLSGFPKTWFWSIVLFSFFQFIYFVLLFIWQAKQSAFNYGIYQILTTILNFGLSLLLVIPIGNYNGFDWQGRILGQVISMILSGLVALYIIYKYNFIKFKFNKQYIRDALRIGLPMIPHAFGAIVVTMVDRFFITNIKGLHETGIYTLGFQIGMIIMLIQDAFNMAYVPYLFEKLKKGDENDKIRLVKFTYLYFLAIIIIVFIFSYIVSLVFPYFVGEKFTNSLPFVFWIALGFAFNGMYKMVVNYIFYIEKTYLIAVVTFSTAIVNVILCYFLINHFGTIGAAYSSCISWFVCFLLAWSFSAKVYPMPWLYFLRKTNV